MPLTARASPRIAELVPCCIDIFLSRSMRIFEEPVPRCDHQSRFVFSVVDEVDGLISREPEKRGG